MHFNHKAFFDVVRVELFDGRLTQTQVDALNLALEVGFGNIIFGEEPPWLGVARKKIGEREIPGPAHNSWISKGWARLGAGWYNDDETPWCGFFIAYCMEAVGIAYPGGGLFARAKAWATWGVPCSAQVGAVGVKSRAGGGHVFFIVGETPDKTRFKALGGNQNNMVSITDILKSDTFAIRWPHGVPQANILLPQMAPGFISTNEA